jgi:hypothetical protein
MKKVLIVGLLVVVLALGTMGTAFATGMNFTNNEAVMSQGASEIIQANVDYLSFSSGYAHNRWVPEIEEVYADGIVVSFDVDLKSGTTIGFSVVEKQGYWYKDLPMAGYNPWTDLYECAGAIKLNADLPANDRIFIPFDNSGKMYLSSSIIDAEYIQVRVIGSGENPE